jgi:phosphoesterase RecJ-like protein
VSTRKSGGKRPQFKPVIDFIRRHNRFILTVHETPDGDALGSEFAMLMALRKIGKEAIILNADPSPEKFRFVDRSAEIRVLKDGAEIPEDIERYVLLILDVCDLNNIGQVAQVVLPRVQRYMIIDHHESEGDTLSGNLILKSASSTSEILYQIFREMGIEIDLPMATALYTGIMFDTGCFIYPKTTALTFEIARDLVARGVSPNEVYTRVYESNSISSLVLLSLVMSTLELAYHNHVAILTMTRQTLQESGALYEESDQIINTPLRSNDIRVSIFFKENVEGLRRCSMRSKGNIDVAAIAQSYGGGGHRTAAGFKCRRSFAETRIEILDRLKIYFDQETSWSNDTVQ